MLQTHRIRINVVLTQCFWLWRQKLLFFFFILLYKKKFCKAANICIIFVIFFFNMELNNCTGTLTVGYVQKHG